MGREPGSDSGGDLIADRFSAVGVPGLLEPDIPLAVAQAGPPIDPGVKRFLFLTLKDVVRILCLRPLRSALYRDARAWVLASDGYEVTFEAVCFALGIDEDYLRDGLARLHAQRMSEPARPPVEPPPPLRPVGWEVEPRRRRA